MAVTEVTVQGRERLVVTIRNERPVALTDLTLSLLAVGHQFETFIESELPNDSSVKAELLVKEVRSGSIIVELFAQSLPIAPLLWEGGSLLQWASFAQSVLTWLLGKVDKAPRTLTKHDLRQWHSILEPVAKDNGSQMNFTVSDGGTVINQVFINSQEAGAAQNRIMREMGVLEDPTNLTYNKKVMTWYQAKFDRSSQTGNKAIIESISTRPLRVIFDNNAVKDAMFEQGVEFSKPWHQLAYIVDVEVQTIKEQPRVATILKFYPEQTFDPSE